MDLSVVVPTLNGRGRLADVLDGIDRAVSDAEVIVVNGPSTDGTGGVVRDHDTPDVFLEIAARNLTVGRNAGVAAADGDVVAVLGQASVPETGWLDGARAAVADGADAVTGPAHRAVGGGMTTATPETRTVCGREVRFFDGGNVAFTREALSALDGFDEYLALGGGRDAAHRLAGMDRRVAWESGMSVRRETDAPLSAWLDPVDVPVWALRARSRAYRLAKNYGPRPTVVAGTVRRAGADALTAFRDVLDADASLTSWLGDRREAVSHHFGGVAAGLRARAADRSPPWNPHGLSSRVDRVVERRTC